MDAQRFYTAFGTDADYWGEDPDYPKADWQSQVANDKTRLGYWDWVQSEKEVAN